MARRAAPILAGAILLALLLYHVGWVAIASVGSWFIVIAAIDLVAMACDAAVIHCFVEPHASYGRAFMAQAVGYAVNALTPGNSLGEPLKITVLANEVPRTSAASAIVLYNVVTMIVGTAVVLIGVPLAIALLDLPGALELAVTICTVMLATAVVSIVVLVRRAPVARLIAIARCCRLISVKRATVWRHRCEAIDAQLRRFGDARSWHALGFGLLSRAVHTFGTLVLLRAASTELDGPVTLGVIALGIPIAWMSSLVPFGVGIADGGHAALYSTLGASAVAGLGFAMLDRARTCLASVIGLAVTGLAIMWHRPGASATPRRVALHRQRADRGKYG